MKKRVIIIVLIVLFVTAGGIYLLHVNKGADTVLEAITQTGRRVDIMIHQEDVQNGVVVFFKSDVGSDYTLNSGFVKKGLLGWKWVLGGGFSGYSGQYFPGSAGTPFPLLFGVIHNPDIAQIQITDNAHKNTQAAPIVGTDSNRIWFIFPDKSAGPDFDIVSSSDKGDVLDSKSFNIANFNF